jgi:hypothetical protein
MGGWMRARRFDDFFAVSSYAIPWPAAALQV